MGLGTHGDQSLRTSGRGFVLSLEAAHRVTELGVVAVGMASWWDQPMSMAVVR